jgi:cob(I)alamin adenosyltransferase
MNDTEKNMMKGYGHVYTGKGKGKSMAALGMALRALGAGSNGFIGQFVKGQPYSELDAFAKLSERITIRLYGRGCFIHIAPTAEDIRLAREGLDDITEIVRAGDHHLVFLDKANIATLLSTRSTGPKRH